MISPLIDAGGLLILSRLQVQNANAISSPLTWGFPAPTAFTGFVHALERRLSDFLQQGFGGIGIICHRFEPQVTQPAGQYTQIFRLTRNPAGKDGKPTALVEEGRAHMEISLVIAVKDELDEDGKALAKTVHSIVQGMRLAGGSILPARKGKHYEAQWESLPDTLDGQTEFFSKLRRRLLPGFALVHREDLLAEHLTEIQIHQSDATALDALLDLCRLNIEPTASNPDKPTDVVWEVRKQPGWLVPLPIGYAGISPLYELGTVANARDDITPFCFVECLYSLGEWVAPHRLGNLRQLLWYTEADTEKSLYRCINHYSESNSA